jgi:hypothetical protein
LSAEEVDEIELFVISLQEGRLMLNAHLAEGLQRYGATEAKVEAALERRG